MAQKSKKSVIAQAALPLFLENGFKGTSVDMVVKSSGVSKPTVYNHFPDKAALIGSVIEHWLEAQPTTFDPKAVETFFTEQSVGLLKLAIGEGKRFPQARGALFGYLDSAIRAPLIANGDDLAVTKFNNGLLARLLSS